MYGLAHRFLTHLIKQVYYIFNRFYDEEASVTLAEILTSIAFTCLYTVSITVGLAVVFKFSGIFSDYRVPTAFLSSFVALDAIRMWVESFKEIPAGDRRHLLRQIFKKER